MEQNHGCGIQSPEILHIKGYATHYGANQSWYTQPLQRRAGCGPTSCSHLLWYLSRTRAGCEALCPYDGGTKQGFLHLMEDVWQYVTPGPMGVNTTQLLVDGALRYGQERGVALNPRVLNVSVLPCGRPDLEEVADFLQAAFSDDLPVAFLNLSNGSLRNLDNWHWVTLVSLSEDGELAQMYDQGDRKRIRVADWINTTSLGGGFVALEPA